MKKITALLLACMMIGCSFTACGKDDDDDSSSKKSSKTTTSASTEADEDDSTEASTEEKSTEASTEEKTTEEKTTEDEEIPNGEGGNLETYVLGKWQSCKMVFDGQELEDMFGIPIHALMHLEIKYNGTIEVSSPLEDEEVKKGTWKVTGKNKITITIDGEEDEDGDDFPEIEYANGKLIIKEEDDGSELGMSIEFQLEKVDEFTEIDMDKLKEDLENSFGGLFGDDDEEE